jgi:hypothetical protein
MTKQLFSDLVIKKRPSTKENLPFAGLSSSARAVEADNPSLTSKRYAAQRVALTPDGDSVSPTRSIASFCTQDNSQQGSELTGRRTSTSRPVFSAASSDASEPVNLKTIRRAQTQEYLSEIENDNLEDDVQWPRLTRVCGILPWKDVPESRPSWMSLSAWYQWLIILLAFLSCAASLHPLIVRMQEERSKDEPLCHTEACLRLGLLSDLPPIWGGVMCLMALSTYPRSRQLVETCFVLHSYARREHFDERWMAKNSKEVKFGMILWVFAVIERIRGTGILEAAIDQKLEVWMVLTTVMFAFSSLVLIAVAHFMLYICGVLSNSVDAFCLLTVGDRILTDAVPRWSSVQAILRLGSGCIQSCLFILQTTVLFTILLSTVDVYQSMYGQPRYVYLLIPNVALCFGVSRVFFKAAEVTDKCVRVPSLINSCNFGEDIDVERSYVVDFVINSAAGFHIFEVRLTSGDTLKAAYVCAVGLCALATQIISGL